MFSFQPTICQRCSTLQMSSLSTCGSVLQSCLTSNAANLSAACACRNTAIGCYNDVICDDSRGSSQEAFDECLRLCTDTGDSVCTSTRQCSALADANVSLASSACREMPTCSCLGGLIEIVKGTEQICPGNILRRIALADRPMRLCLPSSIRVRRCQAPSRPATACAPLHP